MRRETIWVLLLILYVVLAKYQGNKTNYGPLHKMNYKKDSNSYIFLHDQIYMIDMNTYKTGLNQIVESWSSL